MMRVISAVCVVIAVVCGAGAASDAAGPEPPAFMRGKRPVCPRFPMRGRARANAFEGFSIERIYYYRL